MILLTSLSTRRKELLHQIGFSENDFIQVDSPVNFEFHEKKQRLTLEELEQMVVQVARQKIRRAINEGRYLTIHHLPAKETVVVGADTVLFSDGKVFDRPLLGNWPSAEEIEQAKKDARRMLSYLRGRDFYMLTGLVVARGEDLSVESSCCVVTEGKMKNFSDEDIERYIETKEPLDKAGGIGIQERGVVLIEKIKGSYSNVVGLPLLEFVTMLRDPKFEGRVQLAISNTSPIQSSSSASVTPELSVVAVGDINYDLQCNKLPAGFFRELSPPGEHVQEELQRSAGGTAVIFALRAREAGFKKCSVLGVIGGDALGKLIEEDLHKHGIQTLLPADYNRGTSIALVLRDEAENDTALTITNAQQALSEDDVSKAKLTIEKTHIVFISGYCLTDHNRQQAVLKVMEWAKGANQTVVLDATVHMEEFLDFARFIEMTRNKVDVLVAEIPTILAWLNANALQETDWNAIIKQVVPVLHTYFPTIFLRTSTYSHELIITPSKILGPIELDYSQRPSHKRLGYADERTAQHLYQFMSPRLLIASSSPRRLALMKQIVADNKIQVLASEHTEADQNNEGPFERVKRLALEKAWLVLSKRGEYSPTIEIVIGADTEIVLEGEVAGHPKNIETARQILRKLSGRTHEAITGLALISTKTGRQVVDCVSTRVKFKALSESEIEQYIQSGEPIGKAGAYGIQGMGVLFVEQIDGSYSNVIGLPLERLSEILDRDFAMPIWNIDKMFSWNF